MLSTASQEQSEHYEEDGQKTVKYFALAFHRKSSRKTRRSTLKWQHFIFKTSCTKIEQKRMARGCQHGCLSFLSYFATSTQLVKTYEVFSFLLLNKQQQQK